MRRRLPRTLLNEPLGRKSCDDLATLKHKQTRKALADSLNAVRGATQLFLTPRPRSQRLLIIRRHRRRAQPRPDALDEDRLPQAT